jgi:carboxypeptidase C (cathepsin A)
VHINGVVLQSSALNYNTICGITSATVSCGGYVPTYGAIGAYYNLDVPNPPDASLPDFVAQMRTLTTNEYVPAVALYLNAAVAPAASLLVQLANTTGISVPKWQSHFNLGPDFYQANLIPGALIGRYDARVSTPFGSPLAIDGDPSSTFINASFGSAIGSYLASDLQYTNPSTYITLSNAIATWNFAHDGLALPDVIPDLAAAIAQNPKLQVLALNGYHDLATPFFQTERDIARLGVNPNVRTTFYRGGHMTYLDDRARVAEKADLVAFFLRATAPQ